MQNAAPRKISLNPLARYSDVVLALAVVVIVGSMIVPIAPKMMDYLIATNIGISVAVLLAALYVSDASKLPSFPTILLLTTLFRLALNISSTRLILLEANAGDIIFAFGNFVVQGNFVVGGVVFVVLVLVQFIVITKGAERVAEVSARFTLDAMPGKQMSIDAEQRSGALTNEQARKRRQDLERESKLYGAMDGAMKFVKGDAIAAICIAIVNIVGGLVIGVTQMKMSPAEAAQTFSLLTIGDGLVSQIPSLLVGVAAGLVVTRVAGAKEEDQPTHVAGDIVEQIFGQWKAVAITCILLCALATTHPITGLPWGPFLVLAGVLAFGAMGQHAMRILRGEPAEPEPAADLLSTPPAAVSIVLSREVASLIFPENEPRQRRELVRQLEEARDRVARDAGVPIGALNVNEAAQGVPPGGYGLMIYETLVESAVLPRGKELRPGDAAEILVSHLARLLRRHAAEFLGIHETRILFERLEKTHAELIRAVSSDSFLPFRQIVDVLQELLREGVSIRDLRSTLESLARWGVYFREPSQLHKLVDNIRRDLRRSLCDRFATPARTLEYYTISPSIEQMILSSIQSNEFGMPVAELGSQEIGVILQSVQKTIRWDGHQRQQPVLLTASADARRPLRNTLQFDPRLSDVVVMCHDELSPGFERKPLDVVNLPEQ